jgi:hypothetical protein
LLDTTGVLRGSRRVLSLGLVYAYVAAELACRNAGR